MPADNKYSVAYCIMGPERGANRAWHACIALMRKDERGEKEVTLTLGYYAVPGQNFIENIIGFDMRDNHGVFIQERVCDFDVADAMYLKEYPLLTKELYDEVERRCQMRISGQAQAISEHSTALKLAPKKTKARHYPYEENALAIFELEKERSKTLNVPMRLQPFQFTPPNLSNCKFQALEILVGIISAEEMKNLEGMSRTIPRWSGKLDRMFFHAEGPLYPHNKRPEKRCLFFTKKNTGGVVYSRDPKDSQLWLTTCPQNDKIIDLIQRLRQAEKLLEHPDLSHPKQADLLKYIKEHYRALSSSKSSLATDLFKIDHVENAKSLLDTLHTAAIGEYDRDDIDANAKDDLPFLVVPNLSAEKKKQLCGILGKPYLNLSSPQVDKIKAM